MGIQNFLDLLQNKKRAQHRKQLATIQAEPNPITRLSLLRSACQDIQQAPEDYLDFGLRYLESFFYPALIPLLTGDDLLSIDKACRLLTQHSGKKGLNVAPLGFQLVELYEKHGSLKQAHDLLAFLYSNPASTQEQKAQSIRMLAQKGAFDKQYISLYVNYLQQVASPTADMLILTQLEGACRADFSTETEQLQRIYAIANALVTASAASSPGLLVTLHSPLQQTLERTQGLYQLRISRELKQALEHFKQAYALDSTDKQSLLGLIITQIQLKQYKDAQNWLQEPRHRPYLQQDEAFRALNDLCLLSDWLQKPLPGPPPCTIAQFEQFRHHPLQPYVENALNAALGRLYLLQGDAHKAFELLFPLVTRRGEQIYYAAWAAMLIGNPQAMVECYTQNVNTNRRWPVALLLLDTDAALAEQQHIQVKQKPKEQIESRISKVIVSRLELIKKTSDITGLLQKDLYTLEERLELYRAKLAEVAHEGNIALFEELVQHPIIQHLPHACQLFWRGLLALRKHDTEQGIRDLHEAAITFQYHRAALFLAVYYVKQHRFKEARPYITQARKIQHDYTTNLLSAYIEARTGSLDTALRQSETLTRYQRADAFYLHGLFSLYRAAQNGTPRQLIEHYRTQAAISWQRALALDPHSTNLPALEKCASFLVYPAKRARDYRQLWELAHELKPPQPWISWHAAVFLLWYGTVQEIAEATLELPALLKITQLEEEPALRIAQTVAARITDGADARQADTLYTLLTQFAGQNPSIQSHSFYSASFCATFLPRYLTANKQRKQALLDEVLRLKKRQTQGNDWLLSLLLAFVLSQHERKGDAISLLNEISSGDSWLDTVCHYLASLLTDPASSAIPESIQHPNTEIQRAFLNTLRVQVGLAQGATEPLYTALRDPERWQELDSETIIAHLPAFSQQAQQPAFVSDIVTRLAQQPLRDEDKAQLARIATALGETSVAVSLWEQVLKANKQEAWQQEYIRLQSFLAVQAYNNGAFLEAAASLRKAGQQISDRKSRAYQQLQEHARSLELQGTTIHLLRFLFPALDIPVDTIGRYNYIAQIIGQSPILYAALFYKRKQQIEQEWQDVLSKYSGEIPFMHTLGILYRESALAQQAKGTTDEQAWTISTALWVLLLCSDSFWSHFAHRSSSAEPAQIEQVRTNMLQSILTHHSTISKKAFSAGDHQQAAAHLRCLTLCLKGKQALLQELKRYHITYAIEVNESRMHQASAQAEDLFESWVASLVAEAEREAENAEAIKKLPEGIRKNYQPALKILHDFLALEIPSKRVLLNALNWYNQWSYDLHLLHGEKVMYDKLQEAKPIADQLHVLCDKKAIYTRENQILATFYNYYGFTHDDPQKAITYLEESIAWCPNYIGTEELLQSARQVVLAQLDQKVTALIKTYHFTEALQEIQDAEPYIQNPKEINILRGIVYAAKAYWCGLRGLHSEARTNINTALQYAPDEEAIQEMKQTIDRLIRYAQ
uniref:Tetratricopeptide repeat protein n=1 Tax=Thermosporothrix sp. COM3 TaxID=2490863 RepID=A0A455SEM8_9CHLR|nr:hypothetical protein KTC_16780 [Thermosporothrix sp. COM3]